MKARRINTDNYEIVYDDYIKYHTKKIEVSQIITKSKCQKLVEFIVPLPKDYPAIAIRDIKYKITDLKVNKIKNKVLVDGILHSSVCYQTLEGVESYKHNSLNLDSFYGQIRYISVNIPFSCYSEIQQLVKDYLCEIEYAMVEDDLQVNTLENGVTMPQYYCKVYHILKQKVFVSIGIKIFKSIQTFI